LTVAIPTFFVRISFGKGMGNILFEKIEGIAAIIAF
jgi:hypothetical protein